MSRWPARLPRIPATAAYTVAVLWISTAMADLDDDARDRIVRHASTNLHNLAHGRLGTLLTSAFVMDVPALSIWLPCLVCLLAAAELLWGSTRLVVAFVIGHLGATLLVAAGLAAAVEFTWLPASISRASDVGMSYGAMGVVGALTAAVPSRWRASWVGWWLGAGVVVAVDGDFTDAGHLVALLLGIAVSARFGTSAQWSPWRVALAVVGVAFGFLVLTSSAAAFVAAPAGGALGAVAGLAGAALWDRHPPVSRVTPAP
nr:rhomboid-like protein [Mycolicibacterium sp. CAU 1645]